jgi:hypothetical protein
MLAILDESLPTELETDGPTANSVLVALAVCAQNVREGTHILLSERAVYQRLRAFHHLLDARTAAVLLRAEEKLPQLGQVRDFVERALRVVAPPHAAAPSRVANGKRVEVLLPVAAIAHRSSLLGVPMLLVENLNDGKCYLKMAQSTVGSTTMPDLTWLRTVPLRCEILPGGGNTLADLFLYQKAEERRIGLAIADSDCRYPGSTLGATAAALVAVADAAPVSPLLEQHVLDVRAIENCIPRAELRRIAEELDPLQVHRFERLQAVFATSPFWKVAPIKSGVRCFELGQASAESQFWTALFGGRRCDPLAQCPKKSECTTYVVPPLSGQMLARSASRSGLFVLTEECLEGVADTWRRLAVLIYSLFCGTERVTVL